MSTWLPRPVRVLLGLLLSAAGLFLVLRGVDWKLVGGLLREIRMGYLLLAVAAELATLFVGAVRWRWLFWPQRRPSLLWLSGLLGVAQLTNTVLPGRLGLPLRAVLVGADGQISRATALATLVVEKVLEGTTLLLLAVALLLSGGLPSSTSAAVREGSAAGAVGLLLAGVLLWWISRERWRDRFLGWLSRRVPAPIVGGARSLLAGLDALRSAKAGWRLWGWSAVYWLLVIAVNSLVLAAVRLRLPPAAPWLLLVTLQIGARIPASPGNLGVFDYLGVISLTAFGVNRTAALGATFLLHLVFYLPPALVGVGYLLWSGVGLGALRRAASEQGLRS